MNNPQLAPAVSSLEQAVSDLPHHTLTNDFVPRFGPWQGGRCDICWDDWEAGKEIVELPCGHIYHDDPPCLAQGIMIQNEIFLCPFCRREIWDEAKNREVRLGFYGRSETIANWGLTDEEIELRAAFRTLREDFENQLVAPLADRLLNQAAICQDGFLAQTLKVLANKVKQAPASISSRVHASHVEPHLRALRELAETTGHQEGQAGVEEWKADILLATGLISKTGGLGPNIIEIEPIEQAVLQDIWAHSVDLVTWRSDWTTYARWRELSRFALGPVQALALADGTPEAKRDLLNDLRSGSWRSASALLRPKAGQTPKDFVCKELVAMVELGFLVRDGGKEPREANLNDAMWVGDCLHAALTGGQYPEMTAVGKLEDVVSKLRQYTPSAPRRHTSSTQDYEVCEDNASASESLGSVAADLDALMVDDTPQQ